MEMVSLWIFFVPKRPRGESRSTNRWVQKEENSDIRVLEKAVAHFSPEFTEFLFLLFREIVSLETGWWSFIAISTQLRPCEAIVAEAVFYFA
ncbi:hypothetical protein AUR64_03795 [Haloprofundus marisrubri]|uniref:Uncharacterized protein n=1 Tax=Haloprofundus marisrubri TaxID=1514971 RepID=A0A0W1RD79_9EURY|nr:hypothetical protein AUR64_03795 [Haloprofundus marisrubri]